MATEPEDRTALLASVTELGSALRDLVDAAVTTTVDDAELRGVFVTPRPEQVEAYSGGVTDASGRPAPPRRATDATEVAEDR